ncbi:MAG TPA: AAA family ATPase [Gemmataceae bacterium]|nr:AAA family ATPase [Gemmataceae bacterium]
MIKRVRICNFKSLGDVTVNLEPITVLIGRSGTGKTNFVEGLRFLRDYLRSRNLGTIVSQAGGWDRILCATASKPIRLLFDIVFGVSGEPDDYNYTLSFQQSAQGAGPMLDEEKLSLGERVLFHRQQRKWIQPPSILNPPPPSDVMIGAVTGVREITIAYLMLTNEIGCYDFPSTILLQSRPVASGMEGLADNGENSLQVFQTFVSNLTSLNHWRDIVASLRCLNRSVHSVDIRLPDKNAIAVSHAVGDSTLVLELAQESEGFRRFLAHLLALYQQPPKQTLIFEEPEKGLHPGALTALAEEFKLCATKRGGQILLTTHSPELLNQFAAESIRVAVMTDSQTQIGPLVPDQFESLKEHLLDPGELLTVDPARLTTDPVPVG